MNILERYSEYGVSPFFSLKDGPAGNKLKKKIYTALVETNY